MASLAQDLWSSSRRHDGARYHKPWSGLGEGGLASLAVQGVVGPRSRKRVGSCSREEGVLRSGDTRRGCCLGIEGVVESRKPNGGGVYEQKVSPGMGV